jgi:hypothetical protein
MGQSKWIRRSAAAWRRQFSRQSSSGLPVPEFCRRQGINASLFRRLRLRLKGCVRSHRVAVRAEPVPADVAVP